MNQFQKNVDIEIAKGNNISIINLVAEIIKHAFSLKASDVHIDPLEKTIRIRFRIDGVLEDFYSLPKNIHSEIISRIKVLSGLRTDEHYTPQDGRFENIIDEDNIVDIRVSIVPTFFGENIVLRLLGNNQEEYSLSKLGFNEEDCQKILQAIKKPSGMILATGPTGSGKTTTLYALVKILNTKDISIVTIEDPIEYAIDGIKQIGVNQRSGLTFANGLRSILRQDPDIIMVGEIRDTETASIAINTALTGHLLLSTLHTNDAATTLPRLLDMKIEPFLVASTINVAIGQRLVRKICKKCQEEKYIANDILQKIFNYFPEKKVEKPEKFFKGKGCNFCNNTGYFGRIAINEVLLIDEEIRSAILRRASATEIKQIAIKNGMTPLLKDGLTKAISGLTTIEEILRVIHE